MSIKKTDKGWRVDIQPGGRTGKRVSKTLPTKAEALAWEAWAKSNGIKAPGWAPDRADTRKVSALVEIWWQAHGRNLTAGEDMKERVLAALAAMGDPIPSQLTPTKFTEYRNHRSAAGLAKGTLNREHAYLRAVINELVRLNEWQLSNPLSQVRKIPQDDEELTYLTDDQVDELLMELSKSSNRHALPVSKLCLATGLRWSEAEELEMRQLGGNRVSLVGKNRKVRHLPIEPELIAEIKVNHKKAETGNRLFSSSYAAFKSAVSRCSFTLPDGQLTHVLRHTFASAFMQGGGSILTLQRALDHKDLKMTMRYAHLAPDHLEQVVQLNPLARLYRQQQQGDVKEG